MQTKDTTTKEASTMLKAKMEEKRLRRKEEKRQQKYANAGNVESISTCSREENLKAKEDERK